MRDGVTIAVASSLMKGGSLKVKAAKAQRPDSRSFPAGSPTRASLEAPSPPAFGDDSVNAQSQRRVQAIADSSPHGIAQRRVQQMADRRSAHPILQRKIRISGFSEPLQPFALYQPIKSAIDKNRELLLKTFPDSFATIAKELESYDTFKLLFPDLISSPIDYGEVNLDNPQHVVTFFKDAEKYLMKNYQSQKKSEEIVKSDAKFDEELWNIKKNHSPEKGEYKTNTFKTALLGTGASISYYLTVNGRSLAPQDTVIIGKKQPWDPSPTNPQSRGIDFVNHPMHMTSPKRKESQLPERESGKDETFQGNAAKLTGDIKDVLSAYPNRIDATIEKVSRNNERSTKWYTIETGAGKFYALKVIAGLGIGPHTLPPNARAKEIVSEADRREEKKRVMDLDTFQRQLKDPQSDVMTEYVRKKQIMRIGVSGPNAGVDAVHEATKLGMIVSWLVTEGPAIAEGMGNRINSKGLVDLHFDYLSGWTISKDRVRMYMGGKWRSSDPAKEQKEFEDKFSKKNPGWDISQKKDATVDFLVFAQGPAVAKIWNVFDKSATDNLELKGDQYGRFGGLPSGPQDNRVSLEFSNDNIAAGIETRIAKITGITKQTEPKKLESVRDKLCKAALSVLEVATFAAIQLQTDVAVGLGSSDDSLQIIGGSAVRILEYLDNPRNKADVPEKLKGGKKADHMKKVIETLSPTILMNDQLTPTRSQIEASGNFMPGYIGTEESNFVTDDQDMIAAQIASNYANIPPALANWVTQKIIQERRDEKTAVKPGTPQGSRAFMTRWQKKLEAMQQIFAVENIKSLAND